MDVSYLDNTGLIFYVTGKGITESILVPKGPKGSESGAQHDGPFSTTKVTCFVLESSFVHS